MIIALSSTGCSKDAGILPAPADPPYGLNLEEAIPEDVAAAYSSQLAELGALTPEGYKMVPLQFALEVSASSYYDGPDSGSPFAVTISGEGFDEELGAITYYERIDLAPDGGLPEGEGRIVFQKEVAQLCVPDDPALFFRTYPAEVWNPLPKGNYLVAAPVLIKGGMEEYEGAYGEGSRNITFIEGMFDKGVGYFLGYVYIPDPETR